MENLKSFLWIKYSLQSLTCVLAAIALGDTHLINTTINYIATALMVMAAIELAYRAIIAKNNK